MLILVHDLSVRKKQEKRNIQQVCQICLTWQMKPTHTHIHTHIWLRELKAYLYLDKYILNLFFKKLIF